MLDKQTLALVITFLIAGTALGFSIFIFVKAPRIFKKRDDGTGDDDDDTGGETPTRLGRLKKKPVSLSGWDADDTKNTVVYGLRAMR